MATNNAIKMYMFKEMYSFDQHATIRATFSHEGKHQLSLIPLSLIVYETLRQCFLIIGNTRESTQRREESDG